MTEFARFAILGLGTGGLYALSALGIVLIYRGSGVVNFAHGAVGMVGVLCFYELSEVRGVTWLISATIGVLVSAAIGVLIHFVVMRPLRDATPLTRIIATLALLIVLQSAAAFNLSEEVRAVGSFLPTDGVQLLGGQIGLDRILLFVLAVALTTLLWILYHYTKFGLQTSAVAENRVSSAALAISPDRVAMANWAIGSGLAGLAGVLLVPITGLTLTSLTLLVIPALAAALLGGFTSFPLTLLGGIVIGVGQTEVGRYVSVTGATTAVPFVLAILVLLIRGDRLSFKMIASQRMPTVGTGRINIPAAILWGLGAWLLVWFVLPIEWVDAATLTVVIGIILLSIVVVTGYTGQLSLMQYTLAGLGAWFAGRLATDMNVPFILALLLGVVATLPVGFVVGLPAVRVRGVSLAIVTLGLAVTVDALVFTNGELTGGFDGIQVELPTVFGFAVDALTEPERYFTVCLLAFVVAVLAVANIRRGTSGRRLLAVRANERAAAALGIGVAGAKLYAFVIGAGIAALGGILLAFRNSRLLFEPFNSQQSINAIAEAVVGGVGWLAGPLIGGQMHAGGIGSVVIDNVVGDAERWLPLIGGVLLLLVVVLNPDGLAPMNAGAWHKVRDMSPWKRRVRKETIPEVPPIGNQLGAKGMSLEVSDLAVHFGGIKAVDGVNFRVEPGEILGLIGPNGAGKTTVIEAITGFVPLTRGIVALGENSLGRMSPHSRARRGMVRSFQSLELFNDMTVADNLRAAADSRGSRAYFTDLIWPGKAKLTPAAAAAVHEFGLADRLDALPGDLPFGEQRLVAIARAVAARPAVLLLDEPAAGLSSTEAYELGTLLKRLAENWGVAIVLVEHDVDLVMRICNQVVAIEFGRELAVGTPDIVRRSPEVIRAYLGAEDIDEDEIVAVPIGTVHS